MIKRAFKHILDIYLLMLALAFCLLHLPIGLKLHDCVTKVLAKRLILLKHRILEKIPTRSACLHVLLLEPHELLNLVEGIIGAVVEP